MKPKFKKNNISPVDRGSIAGRGLMGFFLFATASRLTGDHPASYPVGNGSFYPGSKVAGA